MGSDGDDTKVVQGDAGVADERCGTIKHKRREKKGSGVGNESTRVCVRQQLLRA